MYRPLDIYMVYEVWFNPVLVLVVCQVFNSHKPAGATCCCPSSKLRVAIPTDGCYTSTLFKDCAVTIPLRSPCLGIP